MSCGSSTPRLPQKSRDQAPPASTTLLQRIGPRSVTTPLNRPAVVSSPRTAQRLEDRGAFTEGGIGDGRRGFLRLGAAVARRVERGRPAARRARQEPVDLVRSDQAGVDLIGLSLREPRLVLCRLLRRLAEIDDAGLAKPGLGLSARVHALPQAQGLDGERDLGEIAPHLAAPAPIAARLLAGDPAFLAQRDRHASLGEEERGRGADDAAADDDDIGLSRKL